MLLFSSQCAAAHVEVSDKLGAAFDAWEKKMFSIPSTHIFTEYFFHILLKFLISHYFSFDSKDGEKKPWDFSFIYCRRHLRPGFKVDFWISALTHTLWEDGLTSWRRAQWRSKHVSDWHMEQYSDILTQTSVSKLGPAASVWWKGLLGMSSSHLTLYHSLTSDLYYVFCHERGIHAFIVKC